MQSQPGFGASEPTQLATPHEPLTGATYPRQGPQLPMPPESRTHCCVPALHCPTFKVLAGPG